MTYDFNFGLVIFAIICSSLLNILLIAIVRQDIFNRFETVVRIINECFVDIKSSNYDLRETVERKSFGRCEKNESKNDSSDNT